MSLLAIKYKNGKLEILDQLLLPSESKYIPITGTEDGWIVINKMQVRGAPAIAIVGCLSLAVELHNKQFTSKNELLEYVKEKLEYLVTSRPTAVNMKTASKELIILAESLCNDDAIQIDEMKSKLISNIEEMLESDISTNKCIGDNGASEILKNLPVNETVRILTHCNTGSLATAGYGTALGVIRSLYNAKRIDHVYCTETRPYNQGARLTAYELVHEKIPSTLIVDSMVAALMKTKRISAVVVGADRVAINGDTANKIGTYQIAITAKYHNVPFYVAVPFTTIDTKMSDGDKILIEERPAEEMTHIGGQIIAAPGITCWNPAFDVTPAALITGLITEKGVFTPNDLKTFLEYPQ